ncbi:MAG TPA: type II secretion system protein GspK [Syntrophobacteraceae bacterium]|nr:type II secretion system protein GspK [Syntrophobacteraceae bacterium]
MRNQRGVVIVAVLWICSLLLWFALQIGTETRLRGEEQVHEIRRSQALHLAIGGAYEALARMGQPLPTGLEDAFGKSVRGKNTLRRDSAEENWQPDGTGHIVEYQTGEALVFIEPEGRKVNVNRANREQLKMVFERTGLAEDRIEQLADVTADFLDNDDLPRLHGGEKDYYQRLGLPYPPFNGPLLSLDQMLLIPGITQDLFFGYGPRENEDRNEASPPPVPGLPGNNSLFRMFTVYGTNTTLPSGELEEEIQEKIETWRPGEIYRLLSCGKAYTGPPVVVLWLIVRFQPQLPGGYEVLYRKIL